MISKKYQLRLIALLFLLLTVYSYPWEIDFAASTIPGWHVTVIQAHPYSAMAITFLLLFNVVAYSFLRVGKIHWKFALLHLIGVLPSLFLFRTPLLFFTIDNMLHYHLLPLDTVFLIVSDCLFFCVQLVFIFLFIKALKNNKIKS